MALYPTLARRTAKCSPSYSFFPLHSDPFMLISISLESRIPEVMGVRVDLPINKKAQNIMHWKTINFVPTWSKVKSYFIMILVSVNPRKWRSTWWVMSVLMGSVCLIKEKSMEDEFLTVWDTVATVYSLNIYIYT